MFVKHYALNYKMPVGKGHHSGKYVAKNAKMRKSEKGIIWTNIYKISPKVNPVIYTMISDCLQNFMNLALGVLEIICLRDLRDYPSLKRRHDLTKY